MARALAPDISIQAVPQGKPHTSVALTLELSGGMYDEVTYSWTDDSRRIISEPFDNRHSRSPTWERPEPYQEADSWITLTCNITVRGTGTNADAGTSDTAVATERARVFYVPPADAPSVRVVSLSNSYERSDLSLDVVLGETHTGNYDTLQYHWQIFTNDANNNFATDFTNTAEGGHISNQDIKNPVWTLPDITSRKDAIARCTVTAKGTNNKALIRSSEATHDQYRIAVLNYDSASMPNVYHVLSANEDPDTAGDEFRWTNGLVRGLERTKVWLNIDHEFGRYDGLTIQWQWRQGATGDWTDIETVTMDTDTRVIPNAVWTRPSVDADTGYEVQGIIVVTGNDVTAGADTTATGTITTFLGTVENSPQAVLPSITIQSFDGEIWRDGVVDGLEGTQTTLRLDELDGHFDRSALVWSAFDANGNTAIGVFNDNTRDDPTFTRPSVETNQRYRIDCRVTVYGEGTEAEDGSQSQTDAHVFTTIQAHQATDAPSIQVESILDTQEGHDRSLFVFIGQTHSGVWDYLTYKWYCWPINASKNTANDLGDTVFNDRDIRYTRWTAPQVYVDGDRSRQAESARFVIRCELTAHGSDRASEEGSTETTFADTIVRVNAAPDAVAPVYELDAVPNGEEGLPVQLIAQILNNDTGTYDRIEYAWEAHLLGQIGVRSQTFGSGKTAVRWTRPPFNPDGDGGVTFEDWEVSINYTAYGEGVNAKDGTTAGGDATITARVFPYEHSSENFEYIDVNGMAHDINNIFVTDVNGLAKEVTNAYLTNDSGVPQEIF